MAGEEPANGERYVTHRRLAEVMDQHRNVEVPAILARVEARIDRRAGVDRVERLERDVSANRERIDEHEDVIQQLRGAKSLVYFLIGSNLLAVVAVVWGILR